MNLYRKIAERADAWFNPSTGFGTSTDKTQTGVYDSAPIPSDPELTQLYQGSGMARKIVRIIPKEMLREGFSVTGERASEIQAQAKSLGVIENFQEAMIWANLYGGSCIFVGADDGAMAIAPLDPTKVRGVKFLQVYDRRYAQPSRWYEDPQNPRFGRPEIYRLQNVQTGNAAEVHESRLILFRGAHTEPETRRVQNGWDSSVLQACYEALRQFDANYKAAEFLMSDASQGVFKIRGFLSALAGGVGAKDLATRAVIMDQFRSLARSVILDSESGEEFTKIQTTFSGIGDVLDRTANYLSAITEIPVTILMGTSPAGLNATGESDIRIWYDQVASLQKSDLEPRLLQVLTLIAMALGIQTTPGIVFPSLWQERPQEVALREKTEAETYALLIANELASPEDIVRARFQPGGPKPIIVDPASVPSQVLPPAPVPAPVVPNGPPAV